MGYDFDDDDDGLVVVYVLAPVTIIAAICVIAYITIKQRKLSKRMLESGQIVPIVPACVTYQTYPQQGYGQPQMHTEPQAPPHPQFHQQQEIISPSGLPPPPPYSK